jgi:hypothetical protein
MRDEELLLPVTAVTTRILGEVYVGPTFMGKNRPISGSVARGVMRAEEKRRAQIRFYMQANYELLMPVWMRAIHAKYNKA